MEFDGSPLPPAVSALLVSAHVDDSLRLPDLFVLRFRDPDRTVLANAKVKIGSTAKISVLTADSQTPEALISGEVTALEAEFDSTGTFTVIRGYDQAHRLFRGRRTETYTQSTASDVATQVARRAGLKVGTVDSTSTVHDHISQGGVTDWEFLNRLAGEIGYEIVVKDGKFDFHKAKTADSAPSAGGPADTNPLVVKMGTDLLRFRSVVTSAEQVKEVQVRGWDLAEKKALTANAPAATKTAELPTTSPAKIAAAFGDPVYVASDSAYRSQSEVDAAAGALAEQIAGAFAEFEGVARGNPKLRANAAVSVENIGAPFEGKYTITTSRHRYDPATRLHHRVRGHRPAGAEPVQPGVRTVGGIADARRGDRRGQRLQRSAEAGSGQADLPLAVGHLRQRLGPDGAGRSGQGPRRHGDPRGRRRGAGDVRAGGHRPAVRHRRAVERQGHPAGRIPRPDRLRVRRGEPAQRGVPPRPPDRPARRGRPRPRASP